MAPTTVAYRVSQERVHMCVVLACVLSALTWRARADAGPAATSPFAALEHAYVVYVFRQYPVVATFLGGAGFDPSLQDIDGRLRDYSPGAVAAEDVQLSGYLRRFTLLDSRQLQPAQRIDREVARAQIRFLLHLHAVRRHQERSLDSYVEEPFRGVEWQLQGMTPAGEGRTGTRLEWQRVADRLHATADYFRTAEEQLRRGVRRHHIPDIRVLQAYTLQIAPADADYLRRVFPMVATQRMPVELNVALLPEVIAAAVTAAAAYDELHAFLLAQFFGVTSGAGVPTVKPAYQHDAYALGAREYDWALRNNLHLGTSAARLCASAMVAVNATRLEMVRLANEIARDHGWRVPTDDTGAVRAVLDQLARDGPSTDAVALAWYEEALARLTAYARRVGLFAVPDDYQVDVTLTPPPLRASVDDAAYYMPPPFKRTGVGTFYVTGADDDAGKLREAHNRAAVAVLAAHEGFPGHDWYYKIASQHRDDISPIRWLTPGAKEDSSAMWEESLASEGWALYAEALLAEAAPGAPTGFYSPEERLAQLRSKLYRDLRVYIDPALHTGRISFSKAVDLFSEVVDFLPGTCAQTSAATLTAKLASCATSERAIFRYSRWPTQAVSYRVGREQIYFLRRQAQARLGSGFSFERFHLDLMAQGPIPPSYFAAVLVDSELDKLH